MAQSKIFRIIRVFVILVFAYPVIGNLLIFSGLAQTLANIKPEKLTMSWERAWTLIPGTFSVEGLEFNSTTPRNQFGLSIDSGNVSISILSLISRTVNITDAHGQGVEVRYAKVNAVSASEESSNNVSQPASSNSSVSSDATTTPVKTKPSWHIKLDNTSASEIRKISIRNLTGIDDFELSGSGSLDNLKMSIVTKGGPMSVSHAKGTMLINAPDTSANSQTPLSVQAELQIAEHMPRQFKGKEKLQFFTGEIRAQGNFASLGAMEFLPDRDLNLNVGGNGELDAVLLLKNGEITDGSRLSFVSDEMLTTFLDFQSIGKGVIEASVDAARDNPVQISVQVDQFELSQSHQPEVRFLEGTDLDISAELKRLFMYSQKIEPNSLFLFNIAKGRISDVGHLNRFMPAQTGIQFLSGDVTTSGGLTLEGDVARGQFVTEGNDVILTAQDRDVKADFEVVSKLTEGNYRNQTYGLKDSSLKLENVQILTDARTTDEGWWGELTVDHGSLVWGRPMKLNGRFNVSMRDVEPLLAGFRDPQKKESALDKMLNVKNVKGSLITKTEGDVIVMDPIYIDSQGLELISRIEFSPQSVNGVMFGKFRKMSANVEIVDSKVKFIGFGGRDKVTKQVNLKALDE